MTEPYQSAAAVEAAIREVTVTPPANRLDLPRLPSNDYRLDLGASVREGSEGRALLLWFPNGRPRNGTYARFHRPGRAWRGIRQNLVPGYARLELTARAANLGHSHLGNQLQSIKNCLGTHGDVESESEPWEFQFRDFAWRDRQATAAQPALTLREELPVLGSRFRRHFAALDGAKTKADPQLSPGSGSGENR